MPEVRYLRRLPQKFALTGLRKRTPITQSFAKKGPYKSISDIIDLDADSSGTFVPRGGSEIKGDLGDPSSFGETPQTAKGFIGQMAGNELAGMLGLKGLRSGLTATILSNLANAPSALYPEIIAASLARGMFSPLALANRAGGITAAASSAGKQGDIVGGMGFDPTTKGLAEIASYVGQPHTLSGRLKGALSGDAGGSDIGAQIGKGQFAVGRGHDDPFGQGYAVTSGPHAGSEQNPAITSALEQYIEENAPIDITASDLEGSMGAGGFGAEVARGGGSAALGIGLGHEDPAAAIAAGAATGVSAGSNVGPGLAPGPSPSPGHGDGGGGDGGGTVLCTVLHNRGIMPDYIYAADIAYAEFLPQQTIEGYRAWATHIAKLMEKSGMFLKIMTPPIMSWAKHMAGNPTVFGALCERVGIPLCRLVGWIKNRSTKWRED